MGKELKGDINKETTVMVHVHVSESSVTPCDDPEDQIVLSVVRVGLPMKI